MKIVTLVENHTENDLKCEHGLSFYIEHEDRAVLLDAGQTGLFAENARQLGIDLSKVDCAVLSHAHYDHAGGFSEFARIHRDAPVYMQKNAACGCFSVKCGEMKNIGIPKPVYESLGERICYVDGDMQIYPGIWLLAHHREHLEKRGEQMHMYRETEGKKQFDDFSHEQSLVYELEDGLVVFNSCSHGGVDLVLEEVLETFPGRKILAMIGGFHLMGAEGADSMRDSAADVQKLAEKLAGIPVDKLYTGHCTGTKAYPILKETLKDKLEPLVTGQTIWIGGVS